MKITLLVIGKTDAPYLLTGIDVYLKRIIHYTSFEMMVLPALKNTKSLTEANQKKQEGEAILSKVATADLLVLLDEKGSTFSSVDFANWINTKMVAGIKNLVFVVGGPYGFSADVYQRANAKISLSEMTFSHQMVRLIFVEQLYRAMTILKGEPYHHV